MKRHKKRTWKLNRLNIDKDSASVASSQDKDYLDFLEDLEEDPKARENFLKFGNPDGKGSFAVGIALPNFLQKKEY